MKQRYNAPYMTKLDWRHVPTVVLQHTSWLPASDTCARAQVCHDDKSVFVRLEADEKNIRATVCGAVDMVCEDSCLEFFFAPDKNDPRYFNFEWNPNGALYLGFGIDRKIHARQIVPNAKELFEPNPYRTETGWGIEFQIPSQFIELYVPEFSFNITALCNFCKCGDRTDVLHYMSWSQICSDTPDYYRREDFGELLFQK